MLKRFLIGFSLFVGMVLRGWSQTPPYNLQIAQQPLPIVSGINANYTGVSGTTSYWYFIIARYGVGNSAPSVGYQVTGINPAGGGSVAVSWGMPTNPSGYTLNYDVVRLTTSTFPSSGSCSACLVASNTGIGVTDSVGTLASGYTLATYSSSTPATLTTDNINSTQVIFNILLGGNVLPYNIPVIYGPITINGPLTLLGQVNIGGANFHGTFVSDSGAQFGASVSVINGGGFFAPGGLTFTGPGGSYTTGGQVGGDPNTNGAGIYQPYLGSYAGDWRVWPGPTSTAGISKMEVDSHGATSTYSAAYVQINETLQTGGLYFTKGSGGGSIPVLYGEIGEDVNGGGNLARVCIKFANVCAFFFYPTSFEFVGGGTVTGALTSQTSLNVNTGSGTPTTIPQLTPATTGQRFVCITTTGQLVSSATACVGT